MFILDIYFSRKKLVLLNLTAIFPEKFAVTSVINIYSSGNYSCTWIMIICIFDKIINLFSLRSRYRRTASRKKLILPLGHYIKTLKEHNFTSNVQFFKVRNNGADDIIWVFDDIRGISR